MSVLLAKFYDSPETEFLEEKRQGNQEHQKTSSSFGYMSISKLSSIIAVLEIENLFSVFLSSYRNTSGSLGEREML